MYLKPRIYKTAGRWGYSHPIGAVGVVSWTLRNAAAVWCRQRNLIEGNL